MKDERYQLYLVTDGELCPREKLPQVVEEAILGGVTMVQLREKTASTREFYQTALRVREITARHGVPLLINDRLDIALAVEADGLHIGQEDLPARAARRILGPEKILGLSAGNLEEALAAKAAGADYLGVGAVFPTATKKDAKPISREILGEIKAAAGIPVVGIGGINAGNLNKLRGSNIDGVAVVSAIMAASDPRAAARELRELAGAL